MSKHNDELFHYGVKGMKWGEVNEEEKTFTSSPQLSSAISNYTSKYNNYQRAKALKVSGKAKQKDVDKARDEAKKAAIDYRKEYNNSISGNNTKELTNAESSKLKQAISRFDNYIERSFTSASDTPKFTSGPGASLNSAITYVDEPVTKKVDNTPQVRDLIKEYFGSGATQDKSISRAVSKVASSGVLNKKISSSQRGELVSSFNRMRQSYSLEEYKPKYKPSRDYGLEENKPRKRTSRNYGLEENTPRYGLEENKPRKSKTKLRQRLNVRRSSLQHT